MRPGNYAVIGANLGDEGKALIAEHLAWKTRAAYVVRFNGGAQAGHTVVLPSKRRHVFHHFGVGTFLGIPTYLGPRFISNPLLFVKEWEDLRHDRPVVHVHPAGLVTSPWQMLSNQIIETHRGDGRHGSCGVGIGETVDLAENYRELSLRVENLNDPSDRIEELLVAQREHAFNRIMEMTPSVLDNPEVEKSLALFDEKNYEFIDEQWLDAVKKFHDLTSVVSLEMLQRKNLIFEGAQGLALDQSYHSPTNPYVTRSSTGLRNVIEICAEIDAPDLTPVYVTRTYLTRHGRGPLPGEVATKGSIFKKINDTTNLFNPFQEGLRFAPLSSGIDATVDRIARDLELLPDHLRYKHGVAITCNDQLSIANEVLDKLTFDRNRGRPEILLRSYGSTRHDIT